MIYPLKHFLIPISLTAFLLWSGVLAAQQMPDPDNAADTLTQDAPATPQVPAVPPPAPPKPEMIDRNMAVLQALDKITARVSTLEVPVGETVAFNSLDITVRACRQPPPLEPPESAAFLEISEARPGEEGQLVFQGWMFASSPALSAMEHPVYDVWVLDCKNVETKAPSSNPSSK